MSKQELKDGFDKIINNRGKHGLKLYACIKQNNSFKLKNINIFGDNLPAKVNELIIEVVKEKFLDPDIEFDNIENIADNKKIIYELKQNPQYKPFDCLNSVHNVKENFSDNDDDNLLGFIFKFNFNSTNLFVYQQAYSGTRIKNKNVLHIINQGIDKYDVFEKELLRIDKRAEILIFNNVLYIKNINVLQEKFGFHQYVRNEAQKVIEIIDSLSMVTNIEKIKDCESEEKLTNAKKLMKIKNSPVLEVPRAILLSRLQKIDKYKDMFVIENNKICTHTKKDVRNLLKMLNDDYLKSELTETEYDSSTKKILIS